MKDSSGAEPASTPPPSPHAPHRTPKVSAEGRAIRDIIKAFPGTQLITVIPYPLPPKKTKPKRKKIHAEEDKGSSTPLF